MSNFFKTVFLLSGLTLLLVFFGRLVGGPNGMMAAFFFACVMNLGAYWWSDKLVLAAYRAKPLSEAEAPEVHAMVSELAAQAGIPKPCIYLIPSAAPNAFATGRSPKHAALAVTQGIFEALNQEELKGVLGHELGQVLNRDILIASIAATLAGAISMLASMLRWGLMTGSMRRNDREEGGAHPLVLFVSAIIIPFAAMLIQLAVSRSREFGADETGARLCGNPLYLASALGRLEAASKKTFLHQADPSSAHLFIVNPLKPDLFAKLFSTHPPMSERIARLERMAGGR